MTSFAPDKFFWETPIPQIHTGKLNFSQFFANISFTFQAVKNLSSHPTYLRFGLLSKFFGDFCAYLGINSFSQRMETEIK